MQTTHSSFCCTLRMVYSWCLGWWVFHYLHSYCTWYSLCMPSANVQYRQCSNNSVPIQYYVPTLMVPPIQVSRTCRVPYVQSSTQDKRSERKERKERRGREEEKWGNVRSVRSVREILSSRDYILY